MSNVTDRIGKYLSERRKMAGIDGDIHVLNLGSEREAVLRVVDIEAMLSQLTTLRAQNELMREALVWYGEEARLARLIHSEGDAGRHALSEDGGTKARNALAQVAK